ncbi:MAG: hypothetical protein EOP06_00515 [Proteobacteria bacterium]|nr:MAG: hypothetical protein EOP06_00515 [Pseudomonadota bacterium]
MARASTASPEPNPNQGFSIDGLISDYSAPEKEFTVTLAKGEVLKFRAVTDFTELQRIKKGAADNLKTIKEGRLPAYKDYVDVDAQTVAVCYTISKTIIEPKWSFPDCLKLAKNAGFLVELIFNEVNRKQISLLNQADDEHIEDLKND